MLNSNQRQIFQNKGSFYKILTQSQSDNFDKAFQQDLYGIPEPVCFVKEGKAIQEKINKLLNEYEVIKDNTYKQMVSCKEKCLGDPIEKPDSYLLEGLDFKIKPLPKLYSFEQCQSSRTYDCNVSSSNDYVDFQKNNQSPDNRTYEQYCLDYNQCAREYIRLSVEILRLQTLHDNMPPKMKLSLHQMTILGF